MMNPMAIPLDRPLNTLTVGDLQMIVAEVVRKVVREEVERDYYVNEDGLKIFYEEEDIAPRYLAELQQHYEDIKSGKVETVPGEVVLQEGSSSLMTSPSTIRPMIG